MSLLSPSTRQVTGTAMIAVTCRIFVTLRFVYPQGGNASWIACLLGAVLAWPVLFMTQTMLSSMPHTGTGSLADRARRSLSPGIFGAVCVFFALLSLAQAVQAVLLIGQSAQYASLNGIKTPLLNGITLLFCALALQSGGMGIAGSMQFAIGGYALAVVIIIISQFSSLNPGWLLPVLGGGVSSILTQTLYTAGGYATLAPLMLICSHRDESVPSALHLIIGPAIASCVLILLTAMLAPYIPDMPLSFRFDSLLTNGRSPLFTQLPLLIVWFSALLSTIGYDLMLCAGLLDAAIPKMNSRLIALILPVACYALTFISQYPAYYSTFALYLYALLAVPILILSIIVLVKKPASAANRS